MININIVKAILAFYLKIKLTRWGIPTDDKLYLPTDETQLAKIKLACKLYYNLHHHQGEKAFLLRFCDELEAIEKKEKESHHSQYAPALFDYPVMSCVIRALRSHILIAASPHKEMSEVQSYLEGEFLDVVKYEDKHYNGSKFQEIKSIKDFVEAYKQDTASFGLLDRVYLMSYKARHPGRVESYSAIVAMSVIQNPASNNKERNTSISTLFTEKAERKKARAERPVLKVAEPEKSGQSSLEAINQILAELEAATKKDREWPSLGMGKK